MVHDSKAQIITEGRASLGIELGSTTIKACLIGPGGTVLAEGAHEWENQLVDGHWSYALPDVWAGIADAYAALARSVADSYAVTLTRLAHIGISAMMHGYLAFDAAGELLVAFRTWRDTTTARAADELTDALGVNIPLRWSVAHYYQALLDGEPHVGRVAYLTTLAGYVHWRLTGRKVLGIGDAVGMFPIDVTTRDYDEARLAAFDALAATHGARTPLRDLLPEVLVAGTDAGELSEAGARLLDPTGTLHPGARACPPEGDAGTGMVATNAVRPRTGNVSVGTSIFAMIVLEGDLAGLHREIDPVTTPAGDPVAMVHCNNGAAEIATWMNVLAEAVTASLGYDVEKSRVYDACLGAALTGPADAGGVLAYNYLSGEPLSGLAEGRPLVARTPASTLSLATFMRAQLFGAYATVRMGMEILHDEGVAVDVVYGHGGLFRTPVVAQRLLAAALEAPVGIAESASTGGAWGIALLARYLDHAEELSLADYLDRHVFAGVTPDVIAPDADDVAGFTAYLAEYRRGLAIQPPAAQSLRYGLDD
ncbi:xylulokinase [Nanchangia anserum]|uniref:ATPase n=2 Tax=Nanchangia anserum TaxID=2692125 RepID=A0A8I0G7V2_9ACTO|nr:FGGY-family carbohydrate kinase [Nanchangia anserum]MBD3689490.1 ATPase [Nanchangia anserum]